MRDIIKLTCGTCSRANYHTTKNKRTMTEKFVIKKFCPACRKHLEHKEGKISGVRLDGVCWRWWSRRAPSPHGAAVAAFRACAGFAHLLRLRLPSVDDRGLVLPCGVRSTSGRNGHDLRVGTSQWRRSYSA